MHITVTVNRYAAWIMWGSMGVIVLALFLLARSLPLEPTVQALTGWVGGLGWWGLLLFGLLYVLATVLFIPGVILTLAAGAIFGLWSGTIIVSLAATTGAVLAFLIARYLAREQVARLMQGRPKFRAIDQAIGEGGWKVVALLRLSPAIPFNVQNYLYGLTPLHFWPYLLASWLAMLPGTFLYVYLGHITGAALGGARSRTTAEWVALGVGLVATVIVTLYVTSLAKKKLREQTEVTEQKDETAPAEQETTEQQEAQARTWPWGATIAALVALLLGSAAVYVQLNPETIKRSFSTLLGPHPAVATKAEVKWSRKESVTEQSFGQAGLRGINHTDMHGVPSVGAFHKVKFHLRPRRERTLSLARNASKVDEHVLPSLGCDAPVSLRKPQHAAFLPADHFPFWPVSLFCPVCSRYPHRFDLWRIPSGMGIISTPLHEGT